MVKRVVSLFKNRAFLATLVIGLFITSVLIISAMMLGQESGNFVVRIDNEQISRTIALTEKDPEDESSYVTRLTTSGIGSFHDNTLTYFMKDINDLKELTKVPGVNDSDASLYCYTFYIVNTSKSAFSINIQMNYSSISKNLDQAIRVLTYNESTESVHIYQKEDQNEYDYINGDSKYMYQPENFLNNSVAYYESMNLGQGTEHDGNPKYVKYSVLFWLEGYDPDCNESILGGAIKFDLDISVQG